jgi:hypothetical protein
VIWALLACAAKPGGPWTAERAVAPVLARLDADRDGEVVAAEWARVDDAGLHFADADADGDGAVSAEEIEAIAREVDPIRWYEGHGGSGPKGAPDDGGPGDTGAPDAGRTEAGGRHRTEGAPAAHGARAPDPPELRAKIRANVLVLRILVEEIAVKDPSIPLPDPRRVEAAGRAGLASPEARALLAELEAASTQAGLAFPTGLRRAP